MSRILLFYCIMENILWHDLVDYINSKEVGEEVTRKEILDVILKRSRSQATVDTLRRMLTVTGYLGSVLDSLGKECLGRYKILKTIPVDLTSSRLKELAYPDCVESQKRAKEYEREQKRKMKSFYSK